MVLVGDDCAIPIGGGSIAGRRGLCGTVFVHKVIFRRKKFSSLKFDDF